MPNLFLLLSLVLSAAVLVYWVRGRDHFVFTAGGRLWWMMPGERRVHVIMVESWPGRVRPMWVGGEQTGREPVMLVEGRQWTWRRWGLAAAGADVFTLLGGRGAPIDWEEFGRSDEPGITTKPARSSPMRSVIVGAPYWMLLAAAATPAVLSGVSVGGRRWRRRRRVRAGQCPRCGYDVRATPGACPECGSVAKRERGG